MVSIFMLITSLAGGGAEKVASELSLHLDPQIQRQIITLTNEVSYPSNKPPLSFNFNFRSLKVLSLLWVLLFGTIKYRRLLKDRRPDISMSFLILDNFINVLANLGKKQSKTILQVHIALSMKFQDSILDVIAKRLIATLYNRADLIIAVSEGVKQELIQEFNICPELVKVIYNPNDIEKIKSLAAEPVDDEWFNGDIPIIFNLGRLTKQKGQWHLIRAFAKVRTQKNCRLVIRGSGDLKPYLELLINELNLKTDVKFLGWVDNPYKYLSKVSLFVSSSLWEALPYALIEAMATGCPVISTDCKYGPREIIGNDKFGLLIPPMDGILYQSSDPLTYEEEFLADNITVLLKDIESQERLKKLGRERAECFNLDNSIDQYNKLLIECTKTGSMCNPG